MDKFEMATRIGFVLVAKGCATFGRIVLKGSDRALVAEFGNMFKGCTVVVDGLNNMIFAYKTTMRGMVQRVSSVVNGVVNAGNSFDANGLDSEHVYKTTLASYTFLMSTKEV